MRKLFIIFLLLAVSVAAAPPALASGALTLAQVTVAYPTNNQVVMSSDPALQWYTLPGATQWRVDAVAMDGTILGTLTDTDANLCDGYRCYTSWSAVAGSVLDGPGVYFWYVTGYDTVWGATRQSFFRAALGDGFEQNSAYHLPVGDGSQPYLARFYVVIFVAFSFSYILLRMVGLTDSFALAYWAASAYVAMWAGGFNAAAVVYTWWLMSTSGWLVYRAFASIFGFRA